MNHIEENICQAIDIILAKRLQELQFNRTIIARIIEKINDNTYRVKYQDLTFQAYTLNNHNYKINDNVYVIILNGEFKEDKFILASNDELIIDDELNINSANPVQNKVLAAKIEEIEEKILNIPTIAVDSELDINSTNPVQNKVVTQAIEDSKIKVDDKLDATSENPVQNKAITIKLEEVFQSVSNGKGQIAAAITDKGVPTAANDTFLQMSNNIRQISTGSGSNLFGQSTFVKGIWKGNVYSEIGIRKVII